MEPGQALGIGLWCAPERIAAEAAAAEAAGFDEVWLGEDFYDAGGIASAALALGATSGVTVGLGVLSAVMRHPALLAMELAALGRAHPGRLIAGIGLGDPGPLAAIGRLPASPLGAVRESVTTVRALLGGGQVGDGEDRIALGRPAQVPIHLGAAGPRMLRLAGEVGEGTILSTGAGPAYVAWARRRIAEGRGGNLSRHRVTALTFISVAASGRAARQAIRKPLAALLAKPVFAPLVRHSDFGEQATAASAAGPDVLDRTFGPDWVKAFAVVGDPAECAHGIGTLRSAGADCVVLCPWGGVPGSEEMVVREVLPTLRHRPGG